MKKLWIALLVIAAAFGADLLRARTATHLHKVKESDDVYALPPPAYVNAMSLGYRDVVASILWASTLYQYGEHVGQNRRFQYSTQYLRTILELDPGFRPAYRFASAIVTMQAVQPSRDELEITKQLLENGTRELPSDAEVWGAYASYLMFEGSQFLDEKTKAAWRVQGAPAATRAVELGYFMDSLAISGSIFLERAGDRDLAIAQLERAYAVAPTDETRDRIAARLRRLQAQESLSRVERVQKFLVGRWRDEAPWLNEGLFVLMGPKRNAAA
ncbi:MAG: hypothetical protein ACXWP4_05840, partial [Polyangiales bacterium]